VLVGKADLSGGDALPVSILTSAGLGLGKELYDASRIDGRASGKDLLANALGNGLAAGIGALQPRPAADDRPGAKMVVYP